MRYAIELRRTEDDRVEGLLRREGSAHAMPFCGWVELLTLLEPPPLDATGDRRAAAAEEWPRRGLF